MCPWGWSRRSDWHCGPTLPHPSLPVFHLFLLVWICTPDGRPRPLLVAIIRKKERIQHLADCRGPAPGAAPLPSLELRQGPSFLLLPPSFLRPRGDRSRKNPLEKQGPGSEAYGRKSPSACSGCICGCFPPWSSYRIPLSALDSSSGTILSPPHSTDKKAGPGRESGGSRAGWGGFLTPRWLLPPALEGSQKTQRATPSLHVCRVRLRSALPAAEGGHTALRLTPNPGRRLPS